MNTLTVRDIGTFGSNYGRNTGFGDEGDAANTGDTTPPDTANGILSMLTGKKVMGVPVWMLGAGAIGAFLLLRK